MQKRFTIIQLYLKAAFKSKFIQKDVTPFSCKFCKEDVVEQYLQLQIPITRLRVKMIIISVLSQDMKKPESAPANSRKAMIIHRETL